MNNPYMELLSAITDLEDWTQQAVCSDHPDPDLWFPEGHNERANRVRVKAAKAICATCPVATQCLQSATDNRERWGVWGGRSRGTHS
jgi:WhiB family redox-sensing transcriptional regulator